MFAIRTQHRILRCPSGAQTPESEWIPSEQPSSPPDHEEWFYLVKQPKQATGREGEEQQGAAAITYIIGTDPLAESSHQDQDEDHPEKTTTAEEEEDRTQSLQRYIAPSVAWRGGSSSALDAFLPSRLAELTVRWSTEAELPSMTHLEASCNSNSNHSQTPPSHRTSSSATSYLVVELATGKEASRVDTLRPGYTTKTTSIAIQPAPTTEEVETTTTPVGHQQVVVLQNQSTLHLQTTLTAAAAAQAEEATAASTRVVVKTTMTFYYHPIVASLDPEIVDHRHGASVTLRDELCERGITVQPEPLLPMTKLLEPASPVGGSNASSTTHRGASAVLFGLYVTEAAGSQQPLPTAWLALAKGYLFVSPEALLSWLDRLAAVRDRRYSASAPPPALFAPGGPADMAPPKVTLHVPPADPSSTTRYVCAAPGGGGGGGAALITAATGSTTPASSSVLSTQLSTGELGGEAAPHRRALFRRVHVFTATDSVVTQVPSLALVLEMCGVASVLDARMTERALELVADRLQVLADAVEEEEEEEEQEDRDVTSSSLSTTTVVVEPMLYVVVDVDTAAMLDLAAINHPMEPDFASLREAGDRGEVPQELVELLHALQQETTMRFGTAPSPARSSSSPPPRLWRLISSDDVFVGLLRNSLRSLPYTRADHPPPLPPHIPANRDTTPPTTPTMTAQAAATSVEPAAGAEPEEETSTGVVDELAITPEAQRYHVDDVVSTTTAATPPAVAGAGAAAGKGASTTAKGTGMPTIPCLFMLSPSQQQQQQQRRSSAAMRYFAAGGPGYATSIGGISQLSGRSSSRTAGSQSSSRPSYSQRGGRGVPGSFLPRGGDRTPSGAQMRAHHRRRRLGSAESSIESSLTGEDNSARGFLGTPVAFGSPRHRGGAMLFRANTPGGIATSRTPLQQGGAAAAGAVVSHGPRRHNVVLNHNATNHQMVAPAGASNAAGAGAELNEEAMAVAAIGGESSPGAGRVSRRRHLLTPPTPREKNTKNKKKPPTVLAAALPHPSSPSYLCEVAGEVAPSAADDREKMKGQVRAAEEEKAGDHHLCSNAMTTREDPDQQSSSTGIQPPPANNNNDSSNTNVSTAAAVSQPSQQTTIPQATIAEAIYQYDLLRVNLYAFLIREGPKIDVDLQMYRRNNYLSVDGVDHALDCAAAAEEYLETIERLHRLEVIQLRALTTTTTTTTTRAGAAAGATTNANATTPRRQPPPHNQPSTPRFTAPLRPRRVEALELFHADCTALWQKSTYLVLQWDRQGRPPLPKRLAVVRRHHRVREEERAARDSSPGSVTPRQSCGGNSASVGGGRPSGRRSATPTRPALTHHIADGAAVGGNDDGERWDAGAGAGGLVRSSGGLAVLSTPCQARAHREWYQRSSFAEKQQQQQQRSSGDPSSRKLRTGTTMRSGPSGSSGSSAQNNNNKRTTTSRGSSAAIISSSATPQQGLRGGPAASPHPTTTTTTTTNINNSNRNNNNSSIHHHHHHNPIQGAPGGAAPLPSSPAVVARSDDSPQSVHVLPQQSSGAGFTNTSTPNHRAKTPRRG